MNPVELSSWYCGHCRNPHPSHDLAQRCCVCSKCGATPEIHNLYIRGLCNRCREDHDAARVKNIPYALYEGTKLALSDDPEYGVGDDFESVCEHRECPEDCDAAHGAFATIWEKLSLDASSILESALESHYEGAWDDVDPDALQKKLDEWLADGNAIKSFHVNTGLRVVPDEVCVVVADGVESFARWCAS